MLQWSKKEGGEADHVSKERSLNFTYLPTLPSLYSVSLQSSEVHPLKLPYTKIHRLRLSSGHDNADSQFSVLCVEKVCAGKVETKNSCDKLLSKVYKSVPAQ